MNREVLDRWCERGILGLVLGTLLFMLAARAVLWIAPLAVALVLLILPQPARPFRCVPSRARWRRRTPVR